MAARSKKSGRRTVVKKALPQQLIYPPLTPWFLDYANRIAPIPNFYNSQFGYNPQPLEFTPNIKLTTSNPNSLFNSTIPVKDFLNLSLPLATKEEPTVDASGDNKPKDGNRLKNNRDLDAYNAWANEQYLESPGMMYLRGMPVWMSAVEHLKDELGLQNNPDYAEADVIRDASGNLQNVKSTPIGDYIRPDLRDPYEAVNMANAANRATQRSLMNSGNNYAGALNANNFRFINNVGNIFLQGLDYNNAQRKQAAEFNRGTNLANALNIMDANKINAGINALRYAAAKDYAEALDRATSLASATKAANRNAFAENASNYALEKFNMDMGNLLAHTNNAFFGDYRGYKPDWGEETAYVPDERVLGSVFTPYQYDNILHPELPRPNFLPKE